MLRMQLSVLPFHSLGRGDGFTCSKSENEENDKHPIQNSEHFVSKNLGTLTLNSLLYILAFDLFARTGSLCSTFTSFFTLSAMSYSRHSELQ